jgi:hypothetical protein
VGDTRGAEVELKWATNVGPSVRHPVFHVTLQLRIIGPRGDGETGCGFGAVPLSEPIIQSLNDDGSDFFESIFLADSASNGIREIWTTSDVNISLVFEYDSKLSYHGGALIF